MERRLAAILSYDVVGYSRAMGVDERGTFERLKAHRRKIIDPRAAQHGGRTIKLIGDGALMEFASVVDAVAFAVSMQFATAERDAGLPEDRRLRYRIGINIGDVIADGDDIYGDGVNVAVRLEGLAEPGGICVRRNVRNQIRGKLNLDLEDLGEVEVKNISRPVRAFRVVMNRKAAALAAAPPNRSREPRHLSRPTQAVTGVALVIFVLVGLGWWQPWAPEIEPMSKADMAFPLPDKPSIAVLPFANMSGDPQQEYFADGISEDLITDLSKISGLFVISRNSAFTYKDKAVKLRQVAEELGVRYVLDGSVRRVGSEVRINAQLIDAVTGRHLWAERYDGTLADVFDLQDKVSRQIVDALALELTPREARQLAERGTESPAAHDAYLLGLSHYYRRTPESFADAKVAFEEAIALDGDYAAAHAALAKMYAQSSFAPIAYADALRIDWRSAATEARRSLRHVDDAPNADFHVVRSWLALNKYQHDRAMVEAERALELSPNGVDALQALSRAVIYAGDPDRGIELAKRSMRQNPALLAHPSLLMGLAEFVLNNPEKAVAHIDRAFALGSEQTDYAGILAAAYAELGRIEEAETAIDVFRRGWLGQPNLEWSMIVFPFSDPEVTDRLARGLERAGIPVTATGYLPLHEVNRLSGAEIEALLSGRTIEGSEFWNGSSWSRWQGDDGAVRYGGHPIQSGVSEGAVGASWVEDDMLCERWREPTGPLELCSVIFRNPDDGARWRLGDYVMVTDTGPHPFQLAAGAD